MVYYFIFFDYGIMIILGSDIVESSKIQNHFFERLFTMIHMQQDYIYIDSLLQDNISKEVLKEYKKNIFIEDFALLRGISRARVRDVKKEIGKVYVIVSKECFFSLENLEALFSLSKSKTSITIFLLEQKTTLKRGLLSKHLLKEQIKKVMHDEWDGNNLLMDYLHIPYLGPFFEQESLPSFLDKKESVIVHVVLSNLTIGKIEKEGKIEGVLQNIMKHDQKVYVLDSIYHFSLKSHYQSYERLLTYALMEGKMLAEASYKPIVMTSTNFLNNSLNLLYEIGQENIPMVILCEIEEPDISLCTDLPLVILETKCLEELECFIRYALFISKPVLIRYTKRSHYLEPLKEVRMNRWEIMEEGNDVVILSLGSMMESAYYLKRELESECSCAIVQMTSIHPVDERLIMHLGKSNLKMIVFDQNHIMDYFIKELHQLGYTEPLIVLRDDRKIRIEEIIKMVKNKKR